MPIILTLSLNIMTPRRRRLLQLLPLLILLLDGIEIADTPLAPPEGPDDGANSGNPPRRRGQVVDHSDADCEIEDMIGVRQTQRVGDNGVVVAVAHAVGRLRGLAVGREGD